ncbi:hypothetical protein ACHAXA_004750 [Cyclostephanos tholiformis]|uniref:Rab-GAP TBC domain-containing protein n=1 Tax=Cyclostephanos tholiformis TaxID=382380 RepID=A0ABD3SSE3_9STRA
MPVDNRARHPTRAVPRPPPNGTNVAERTTADRLRTGTSLLPRCVRWRLSLGMLKRPAAHDEDDDDEEDDAKSTEDLLKSIEDANALGLRCQRSRYDDCETTHYWKCTPTSIANDTTTPVGGRRVVDDGDGGGVGGGGGARRMGGMHPVAPGDDPLSALLGDAGDGSEAWDEDGSSGGGVGGIVFGGASKSKYTTSSDAHVPITSSKDVGDVDRGVSRWREFYNTREVLDVIEKDLDRLPSNHYTAFHQWRMSIRGNNEHRLGGGESKWPRHDGDVAVAKAEGKDENCRFQRDNMGDESHSRKDEMRILSRAIRDRPLSPGQVQNGKGMDNLIIKDDRRKQEEYAMAAAIQSSIKERAVRMSQILFVYAKCHPEVGYRQGMHEVLSYVLLAFEMDLLEYNVNSAERGRWDTNLVSSNDEDVDGCRAGVDSSENVVAVRLIDPEYILHDAFNLFECIMTTLAHAYDVIPTGDDSSDAILKEARIKRGEYFASCL